MNLSEKKTYLLALVIVVSVTLVITVSLTVGLLSLTEPDYRSSTDDGSSFDIKDKNIDISDLIYKIQIESRDSIISQDYIADEADIESSEELMDISPYIKNPDILNIAQYRIRRGKWILIDKSSFTLSFYNRGELLREWNVAVGIATGDKQRKGDNRTPNGIFKIRQIQNSSEWTHDFMDGQGEIKGAYGPWFIRLHTPPWTGIGIHGTHDPDSLGSRASEGCIRMNNEDVDELKEMVKIGMPVIIVE